MSLSIHTKQVKAKKLAEKPLKKGERLFCGWCSRRLQAKSSEARKRRAAGINYHSCGLKSSSTFLLSSNTLISSSVHMPILAIFFR